MSISIYFRTWLYGCKVGEDAQGNRYYEDKRKMRYGRPRRWVMYKGKAEATKIPSQWHGWLHLTTEPPSQSCAPYPWEKDHLPNLTGTPRAHKPIGLKGLKVRKIYEPWIPK